MLGRFYSLTPWPIFNITRELYFTILKVKATAIVPFVILFSGGEEGGGGVAREGEVGNVRGA